MLRQSSGALQLSSLHAHHGHNAGPWIRLGDRHSLSRQAALSLNQSFLAFGEIKGGKTNLVWSLAVCFAVVPISLVLP